MFEELFAQGPVSAIDAGTYEVRVVWAAAVGRTIEVELDVINIGRADVAVPIPVGDEANVKALIHGLRERLAAFSVPGSEFARALQNDPSLIGVADALVGQRCVAQLAITDEGTNALVKTEALS